MLFKIIIIAFQKCPIIADTLGQSKACMEHWLPVTMSRLKLQACKLAWSSGVRSIGQSIVRRDLI